MRLRPKKSRIVLAEFARGDSGVVWKDGEADLELSGLSAWQSNGGPGRGHPARALPYTLRIDLPETSERLVKVYFYGVFALWAEPSIEGPSSIGAVLTIGDERTPLTRIDFLSRRHYDDAGQLEKPERILGDGTSLRTVGSVIIDGKKARVDEVTVDVPEGPPPASLWFRDMGTPASFVIFDVALEYEQTASGCPFHSGGGGVSLADLPGIMRVGDRVRFGKAIEQLEQALLHAGDLDEARGEALTFIAVVTASMLEMGGSRSMHRVQLQSARLLDELTELSDIAREAKRIVEDVASATMSEPASEGDKLMDRAITLIHRNYSKDLNDETVAEQLGLSRSHFRFLFKNATHQPFHKYLTAVRLEEAKKLLLEAELPVTKVAMSVGFASLSHFSRAFAQRFGVSPTNLRRTTE